jgi:hypothetical protein
MDSKNFGTCYRATLTTRTRGKAKDGSRVQSCILWFHIPSQVMEAQLGRLVGVCQS